MERFKEKSELLKVTVSGDFELPVNQNILRLFTERNFTVDKVDSCRPTPVVEYKGELFTGTEDIITHFFPDWK